MHAKSTHTQGVGIKDILIHGNSKFKQVTHIFRIVLCVWTCNCMVLYAHIFHSLRNVFIDKLTIFAQLYEWRQFEMIPRSLSFDILKLFIVFMQKLAVCFSSHLFICSWQLLYGCPDEKQCKTPLLFISGS